MANNAVSVAQQGNNSERVEAIVNGDEPASQQNSEVALPIKEPLSQQDAVTLDQRAQTEQPDPYELRDLNAQEVMADAAVWMAVAAFLTLLVTGMGTILIWRQVRLTREAVEDTSAATEAMVAANRIARDEQRPWVDFEIDKVTMFTSTTEFATEATINLVNLGKTPALNVKCNGRIVTGHGEQANFGESYPPEEVERARRALNLLPGGRGFNRLRPSMERSKLGEYSIRVGGDAEFETPLQFHPSLEVVVSYQWGDEPTPAVTKKHFTISSIPGDGGMEDHVGYPIQLGTVPLPRLTTFEVGVAEVT